MSSNSTYHSPDTVISFWFEETTPKHWYEKTPDIDQVIMKRFGAQHNTVVTIDVAL
jgi:uncharacterized protein (DUF924 family)